MTIRDFREILEDNRGKETNFYRASCCVEGEVLMIYTNLNNTKGYIKTDSILNYIEDEGSRKECNDSDFENFEVYVRDFLSNKSYELCGEFDEGEKVTFAYKDCEGIELFKSKKDFNSIKNTYKEILNSFDLDLNIDEIEEIVKNTEVNGIKGFQKLISNTIDYLKNNSVNIYRDALPDLYIKVLSEKDFYYIAYSVFL